MRNVGLRRRRKVGIGRERREVLGRRTIKGSLVGGRRERESSRKADENERSDDFH